MRNTRWLRYGLGSFTIAAAAFGGLLVACGDDDSDTGPRPDSGLPDTGGPGNDSGLPADAGQDAAKAPPAKLQLVNAATDLGPGSPAGALRVCYAVGLNEASAQIAPLPPLPDQKSSAAAPFAGVFIGTGGNVQGTGADLSALTVIPYVMSAERLAAKGLVKPASGSGVSCSDMLKDTFDAGAGPLELNVDYWKLPGIPAGILLKEKSFILVLTGCAADTAIDNAAAKCGPGFTAGAPGNGNLKVTVHEVDRSTTIAADKIGTQFIHASAALEALLPNMPGAPGPLRAVPGYISNPSDPLTFKGVTGDPDGGVEGGAAVDYNAKTALVQISEINVASDSFTAQPLVARFALPLPVIQQFSYGGNVPEGGAYRNGAAFTFIALGDPGISPDAGGGAINTKTFHYIALPNDPPVSVYQP